MVLCCVGGQSLLAAARRRSTPARLPHPAACRPRLLCRHSLLAQASRDRSGLLPAWCLLPAVATCRQLPPADRLHLTTAVPPPLNPPRRLDEWRAEAPFVEGERRRPRWAHQQHAGRPACMLPVLQRWCAAAACALPAAGSAGRARVGSRGGLLAGSLAAAACTPAFRQPTGHAAEAALPECVTPRAAAPLSAPGWHHGAFFFSWRHGAGWRRRHMPPPWLPMWRLRGGCLGEGSQKRSSCCGCQQAARHHGMRCGSLRRPARCGARPVPARPPLPRLALQGGRGARRGRRPAAVAAAAQAGRSVPGDAGGWGVRWCVVCGVQGVTVMWGSGA